MIPKKPIPLHRAARDHDLQARWRRTVPDRARQPRQGARGRRIRRTAIARCRRRATSCSAAIWSRRRCGKDFPNRPACTSARAAMSKRTGMRQAEDVQATLDYLGVAALRGQEQHPADRPVARRLDRRSPSVRSNIPACSGLVNFAGGLRQEDLRVVGIDARSRGRQLRRGARNLRSHLVLRRQRQLLEHVAHLRVDTHSPISPTAARRSSDRPAATSVATAHSMFGSRASLRIWLGEMTKYLQVRGLPKRSCIRAMAARCRWLRRRRRSSRRSTNPKPCAYVRDAGTRGLCRSCSIGDDASRLRHRADRLEELGRGWRRTAQARARRLQQARQGRVPAVRGGQLGGLEDYVRYLQRILPSV